MICGSPNLTFSSYDACVQAAVDAEARGDGAMFFTSQMQGYYEPQVLEEVTGRRLGSDRIGMGFPDPAPLIAAIGQRTTAIELLITAYDTIRRGPAVLAQTLLTLDHATRGRTTLALGAGELKQLAGYGYSRRHARQKLAEGLRSLRALLDANGEPVHSPGDHWPIDGGRLPIRPYGERPPPILATPGPDWELLGSCADGLLTSLRRHPGGLDGFRSDVASLRTATAAAARDPAALHFAGVALCLVHEDPVVLRELQESRVARFYTLLLGADRGVAWRDRGHVHPLGDDWGYARHAAPGRATIAELNAAVDTVPPEAVADLAFFCGSREQVAEKLAAHGAAGLTHASIVDYSARIDPSLTAASATNVAFLIDELQRIG